LLRGSGPFEIRPSRTLVTTLRGHAVTFPKGGGKGAQHADVRLSRCPSRAKLAFDGAGG